jgi:hypothetical protein
MFPLMTRVWWTWLRLAFSSKLFFLLPKGVKDETLPSIVVVSVVHISDS